MCTYIYIYIYTNTHTYICINRSEPRRLDKNMNATTGMLTYQPTYEPNG